MRLGVTPLSHSYGTEGRLSRCLIVFILFAMSYLVAGGVAVAQMSPTKSPLASKPPNSEIIMDEADFRKQTTWASRALLEDNHAGIDFYAAISPETVRLYISGSFGKNAYCNGIIISSDQVLTAGHCLCNDPVKTFNFETCSKYISQKSVSIFVPGRGVYHSVGMPQLNPRFVHPERYLADGAPTADLVILSVDHPLPGGTPVIRPPMETERPAGPQNIDVSFSEVSFLKKFRSFEAGKTYSAGAKSIGVHKRIMHDDCGEERPPGDAICTVADGRSTKGRERGAAACPGDSGAPLFQMSPDGALALVGMTSAHLGNVLSCEAESHQSSTTRYTRLADHAAWIETAVGGRPKATERLVCSDEFLLPGEGAVVSGVEGSITILPISPISFRVSDVALMQAVGSAKDCEEFHVFDSVICSMTRDRKLNVSVPGGVVYMEVIFCRSESI